MLARNVKIDYGSERTSIIALEMCIEFQGIKLDSITALVQFYQDTTT